jgi:hypothetical protein
MLELVLLEVCREMWFQHDGTPADCTNVVLGYWDEIFGNRWIGRGVPIIWPPRSPDLTPLDFCLCGYMQSLVYETPVETQHDLVGRIAVTAGTIRESFKEFSITKPGGEEHAIKSAAAILSNYYNVKQR